MKFIDFFAGIGGFRRGLELAGHECVGFCEYDKFAVASYTSMHLITDTQRDYLSTLKKRKRQKEILKDEYRNDEWYTKDIRAINAADIPKSDCWCFGFPCQDISVAGKQTGLSGNRSSLFFAVTKLIRELEEENKPRYLFIENVKNLLSVNRGRDFARCLMELDEIGYDAEWEVINSSEYVPQNRERIFIIGHLRGKSTKRIFPIERSLRKADELQEQQAIVNILTTRHSVNGTVGHIVKCGFVQEEIAIPVLTPNRAEKRQNGRRFKDNGEPMFTLTAQDRHGVVLQADGIYTSDSKDFHSPPFKNISRCLKSEKHDADVVLQVGNIVENKDTFGGNPQRGRVYDTTGISPALNCCGGGGLEVKIVQRSHGFNAGGEHDIAPTLTSNSYADNNLLSLDDFCIRKLTPKECFRLQGWTDDYFKKAEFVNSKSQLYKRAGNGVTVPVIKAIGEKMRWESN